jgi:hypothetical protein
MLLAALAVFGWPCLAHARLVESWPYERLMKEADVVVIVMAVSTRDSGETLKDNPWKAEFQGMSTSFEVKVLLKGKVEGDKLTVLHYRLKPGLLLQDGPSLVSFRTRGITITTKEGQFGLAKPSYLLFLKKRADVRYQAVSGQVDPSRSVREMYHPLPEGLGKADSDR